MSKSYAGDKDGFNKNPQDAAGMANDAARKAEQRVEEIKREAANEVKKQQGQ
ncbi:hypothetical protein AB1K83_15790 [Sporosarcina sp. 179-K 3D1 HS]|uniref:hypothetical protein n=1 Tax=Sporosarcina sp. 179-K 3D1 HS TaxID=3232169 RepID=UPI00399FB381